MVTINKACVNNEISNEKRELVEEIEMILEKVACLYCMDMKDLEKVREALQPAVDEWNDEESEYQHLVDTLGGGNDPYNYERYIPNKHERRLLNTLTNLRIDSYHCFLPVEAMNQISQDYIEHKSGYTLDFDYKNGVIMALKN